MHLAARYADGRAAVTQRRHRATSAPTRSRSMSNGAQHVWPYAELARADDDNGRIVLRRRQAMRASGSISSSEAAPALREAAPRSLQGRARMASKAAALVAALAVAAFALAARVPRSACRSRPSRSRAIMPARYQRADRRHRLVAGRGVHRLLRRQRRGRAHSQRSWRYRLMADADIAVKDEVWVTIVDASFPNAFALPDNSIVVTDDLIAAGRTSRRTRRRASPTRSATSSTAT